MRIEARTWSSLVVGVFALLLACGEVGDGAPPSGASGRLEESMADGAQVPTVPTDPQGGASEAPSDDDLPVPPAGEVGTVPPPPSPEELEKATECSRLQSAARASFGEARRGLEVDQCQADGDCKDGAFDSFDDACWGGDFLPGTRQYGEALGAIADELCAEFREKDCDLFPRAGPILPVIEWACRNAACVAK
jgi:hypothetical protein